MASHYKSFADDASVTFSFTLLIPIYLFSYAVDRKNLMKIVYHVILFQEYGLL